MCSRKLLSILSLFLLVGVMIVPHIFAASVSLQNTKSQIGVDEEYPVDINFNISAKDGTTYYLRGVFYKPGTSNYCGYTWNGNSWFNGPYTANNGWTNFLAVTVTNSSWSGQLKAKIDATDAGCSDSGTYSFKVERFTTSGSGSFDTQTEQTVSIIIPTATPTSVPTNTPIPATATPTTKPIPSPTKVVNTPTLSSRISPTLTGPVGTPDAVLGTMSSQFDLLTPTAIPTIAHHIASATTSPHYLIFAIAGFCIILSCGILIFFQLKKTGKLWWTKS